MGYPFFDPHGTAYPFLPPAGSAPLVLAQTGIPVCLQSSGTMGANGALSAITALPVQYASCYMYFPAGKAFAGSAAGLYYVVMSSTTAGTVYNNVYDPTTRLPPTIPASLTAIVDAGPGAYTQTTAADIVLGGVTLLANVVGANGSVRIEDAFAMNNTVNNKTVKNKLGASTARSAVLGTGKTLSIGKTLITNRGVQNKQHLHYQNFDDSALAQVFSDALAVDLSAASAITFTAQLATATDYVVLEGYVTEVLLGA